MSGTRDARARGAALRTAACPAARRSSCEALGLHTWRAGAPCAAPEARLAARCCVPWGVPEVPGLCQLSKEKPLSMSSAHGPPPAKETLCGAGCCLPVRAGGCQGGQVGWCVSQRGRPPWCLGPQLVQTACGDGQRVGHTASGPCAAAGARAAGSPLQWQLSQRRVTLSLFRLSVQGSNTVCRCKCGQS